jgi:NADH-quinone oxidoreductase subunit F
MKDLDLMVALSDNIAGKTVCAFGDAEVTPILSTLKHFRAEYETHIHSRACPYLGADQLLMIGG